MGEADTPKSTRTHTVHRLDILGMPSSAGANLIGLLVLAQLLPQVGVVGVVGLLLVGHRDKGHTQGR